MSRVAAYLDKVRRGTHSFPSFATAVGHGGDCRAASEPLNGDRDAEMKGARPMPSDGGMTFSNLGHFPPSPTLDRIVRTIFAALFTIVVSIAAIPAVRAADLVLATEGKSDYQIVVPDTAPTPALADGLQQTARLLQAAFQAHSFTLPIVSEARRDDAKPAIFLGDTTFARQQGVAVAQLKGWSYVLRVSGRDVIIAGREQVGPGVGARKAEWDRVGTAKGVTEFLRQYLGVRFLYPDLPPRQAVKDAARLDLLASPAFEFLPTPRVAVPADLNVMKTPVFDSWTAYPPRGGFYEIANNRFPRVDDPFGGHTWERAVPPEKYLPAHPEYFALLGGQRMNPKGVNAQYCISNPDVQELFYQDLIGWLDAGYQSVDLGQPDGFRACQCGPCAKLFDTGGDWSEKLWILHRKLAERVLASHPGKVVNMTSYILTANPPKSFLQFPANTQIMLTGTNDDDLAPWRGHVVPQGFTGYIYNWCPNLSTRYTPMRTPGFVETQAKRLVANRIQSIYQDGPGTLQGLEGPVYYTMGRMFDDVTNSQAKVLVHEFCGAAFGKAAPPMLQFYDQLYHAIELYSRHLGTRDPAWTYTDIYGRRRKHLTDPMQFLGFFYPPTLLASLEAQLAQAEKLAHSDKIKTRLALVRREFDYLRGVARVVHLNHAFQIQPDRASRDRLLDAIDARNAEIATYFDERGRTKPFGTWSYVPFPPVGHDAKHLRLSHDGYQEPYANTPFNWDTKTMRNAPLAGAKRLPASAVAGPVTFDSAHWAKTAASELVALPGAAPLTRKTTVRATVDDAHLYVLAESELPAALQQPDAGTNQESFALYLAPVAGRDLAFRFTVGPRADAKADAAAGFVTDAMDPRHGQFDPDWNGDWKYESRLEPEKNRWLALLKIPFKTLGVEAPKAESFWRANFARAHVAATNRLERALWSVTPNTKSLEDRNDFGELVFAATAQASAAAALPAKHPLQVWRDDYNAKSFELPADWKKLPDLLPAPLGEWRFRTDPLEQGVKLGWHQPALDERDWVKMTVPSFWAENAAVGSFQGHGWYRTTVTLPAGWQGRGLRLLFGSVDEQAWVYVNGQLVREHSEQSEKKSFNDLWELPFIAEVPPSLLKSGQPNVVAVRVHNSTANGGLWRPVLVQSLAGK